MHRKTFVSIIVAVSVLGLVLAGSAVAMHHMPGKGVTVNPARATWTTGFFLEAIYSRALEELGFKVKDPKKLANPIFYQSLANGDVDYWANGWFPLHHAQLPKGFDKKATTIGYVVKAGGMQGYLASKAAVEKFGIKTLADFKRPEVKKAFDANKDGKADLVACPPGWGCEKVITHHLKVYGLENHVNQIKAAYEASMADAVARFNAGEPVLYYTWAPNWTIYKMKPGEDVMWIGVPEIIPTSSQEGMESALVASGIDGAVSDPLKVGWIANDIRVVANKKFLDKNPAAKRLFEVMSIPLEDIALQNNRMFGGENTEKDIERHVSEWIALNKDKWEDWLEEARKAAK